MVAKFHQKPLNLVLKQNYEHKQTYAHEFVKNSSYQLHLQNLRSQNPDHYKGKHPEKYIYSTALLHYAVKVVKQQRGYRNVKSVSYSKSVHGFKSWFVTKVHTHPRTDGQPQHHGHAVWTHRPEGQ